MAMTQDEWVKQARATAQQAYRDGKAVDHVGNARRALAAEKAAKAAKGGKR
jgi:hypothetical protein